MLTSSWEIDFFGRVGSLKEAALAQYLASEESRKGHADQPGRRGGQRLPRLLADDELLALTQQTLATRDESVRLTKLRFDNGAAPNSTSGRPNRWPRVPARPWPNCSASARWTKTP